MSDLEPVETPSQLPTTATLTDEQRRSFLDHVAANKTVGNVAALRAVGVQGTRGQLHTLLDRDDLAADAREARGWSITKVEQTTWDVAADTDHPSWDRANARILKAYHPAFRDAGRMELTGKDGGPIALLAGQMNFDHLSLEELETLRAIVEKAQREDDDNGQAGVHAVLPTPDGSGSDAAEPDDND